MKTILVPTDYSDTARNATRYAIHLAKQLRINKIVLYNAYQAPPVISEPAMPAIPYVDIDTLRNISIDGMNHFKKSIAAECPVGIELEEKIEYAVLSDEVERISDSVHAELIVMGITGTTKIEEVLIGSTALSVMKHTRVPVVIVPSDNKFSSITNVMLATDLKKVAETTPAAHIRKIMEKTSATLHVVNVYENESEISADKIYQQELLHGLLRDFNPEFHVINNDNFLEGINEFVASNAIDLVIAIPKKHGFFAGLFKESHSKQLAFHTHVPLMYIHNEDL